MPALSATPRWSFNDRASGAAGGAEVSAYDAARKLVFVLGPTGIDALDAATGALRFSLPGTSAGGVGNGNSVAVKNGVLAVAYDGATAGAPGTVALYQLDAAGTAATLLRTVPVGVVPDMVTFTADGSRLLVAIEGEPTANYATDAPGGVAVIDVATGASTFVGFEGFDAAALRAAGVRITGPAGTTAATDLEPEYIALSADGTKAYVTLQENNAVAVLDLATLRYDGVFGLGTKDFSLAGSGLDPSDRDGGANIVNAPVRGLLMPDGIASFSSGGRSYVVTANEGDTRDYGSYTDSARLSTLNLDEATFGGATGIAALKADASLGRLLVSTRDGDTDGDGDIDVIHAVGGRSFSIFEVTAEGLTRTFDSGDMIERMLIAEAPTLFADNRSDDKGPEPESVTLQTIDGQLFAFVALERAQSVMAFRIESPTSASYAGILPTGGLEPEVVTVVAAQDAPAGTGPLLIAPNENSGITTGSTLSLAPTDGSYTLQILHGSDFEAGLAAVSRAKNFAAIVDKLEDSYSNSITLSSGDNFLPGPFLSASTDPAVRSAFQQLYAGLLGVPVEQLAGLANNPASADLAILNAIGVQASVFGNHDWDLGPNPIAVALDFAKGSGSTATSVSSIGAQFPYLSANLNFNGDAATRALYTAALREAASFATTAGDLATADALNAEAADQQIAPWTVITEGGQRIGILGVTTQILSSISSNGGVNVLDPAGDGGVDNTAELASILQPLVDQMTAQGINKIVLLSHLQQYQLELDLATKLSGVDVIVAGGSHAVFADGTDALRPGDTAAQGYPVFQTGADGRPVAVVNTGNEYSYVGRLAVTFDGNGVIIPTSVDPNVSGAYATTDEAVASLWQGGDAFAAGTRGGLVKGLTDAIGGVINAQDANLFGFTEVFLEGRRGEIRTEETNLGNLSADANLFVARQVDATAVVSLKNGGGVRAEIGTLGLGAVPEELPPGANPNVGKPEGAISELDIKNSLRFNNALSLVTVTAAELERLFEHGVAQTAAGATPGRFPQVGGVSFSFDAAQQAQVLDAAGNQVTEGLRIRNLVILDEQGFASDVVVRDGVLVGDANREIRMVTLSFLADGGDGYPLNFYAEDRIDLLNSDLLGAGAAGFAAKGSEQDAFAEYLLARHGTAANAFAQLDTAPAGDTRVQNLAARADAVQAVAVAGTAAAETLAGTAGRDVVAAGAGDDVLVGNGGFDVLDGGEGFDTAVLRGSLSDYLATPDAGALTILARNGLDAARLTGIERLQFDDGAFDLGADPLFDAFFYLRNNADVFAAGVDARAHYLEFGAREGRDPNALFSSNGYLSANADVAAAGLNPLEHFRQYGRLEGRDPSAGFDGRGYLARNPDVAASGVDALHHYLRYGQAEGRDATPAIGNVVRDGFDAEYYLLANVDVGRAGIDALTHYRQYGRAEGRDPNGFFEAEFYLARNADVAASGIDPLTHYLEFGGREGRDPSARFDSSRYLADNPDVAAAGANPLAHFLQFGAAEGRAVQDALV